MNHPRYRVKTLLIATTITAVVVACLAPWLRLVTASQLTTFLFRLACSTLGALLGYWLRRWQYTRLYSNHSNSDRVFTVSASRVQTNKMSAVLLFGMYLFIGLTVDIGRTASPRAFVNDLFFWGMMGTWVPFYFPRLFMLEGDALITDAGLVHPCVSMRWSNWTHRHKWTPYRWLDRDAGILEVTMAAPSPLQLHVRPEDIEAVDELLRRKLPDHNS